MTRPLVVEGKHEDVALHVARPVQMETPLELLRQARITDKRVLFVRNNQDLEGHFTTAPSAVLDWRVEVGGLVERPGVLSADDLKAMPRAEVEMVLQCAGNSRAFFSEAAEVKGAPWGHGAVANVSFGGVPLRAIFERFGVREGARYLSMGGRDGPLAAGLDDFERSVPLADVLDSGLIALTMNGEPIAAIHGGPARLVLPGFYSVNCVKWLSYLRLDARPTQNHYQTNRYRIPKRRLRPGEAFEATEENSDPCWLQKTKSFIWAPLHGERLSAPRVEVSGPAWTSGRSRLARVEVSVDEGATWQEAEVTRSPSPYAWSLWRRVVELVPGERAIWARAWDEAGGSQPLCGSVGWNPRGYEYSGVHKIRVMVSRAVVASGLRGDLRGDDSAYPFG